MIGYIWNILFLRKPACIKDYLGILGKFSTEMQESACPSKQILFVINSSNRTKI